VKNNEALCNALTEKNFENARVDLELENINL
jgi:hypothetical protein